jgi:hypothetical protein
VAGTRGARPRAIELGVGQQAGDESAGDEAQQQAALQEVVDGDGTQQQRAGDREAEEDLVPVRLDEPGAELTYAPGAGFLGCRLRRQVVGQGRAVCPP